MDFKSRLKGDVTQILISSLLKDASYRIVPLGIEEAVRDVQALSAEEYFRLGLSRTLRSLPDFLVTSANMDATWMLEVKFRKQWDEETRTALAEQLLEQASKWQPLHLVVALGIPARANNTPASHLGILPLTVRDGVLGTMSASPLTKEVKFKPWGEVTWDSFRRIQDVFTGLLGCYDDATLIKTTALVKGLTQLDVYD